MLTAQGLDFEIDHNNMTLSVGEIVYYFCLILCDDNPVSYVLPIDIANDFQSKIQS